MPIDTTTDERTAATAVFRDLLTQANGGTAPAIHLDAAHSPRLPVWLLTVQDRRDKLLLVLRPGGRLEVVVGVATHWTTLWSPGFVPARTASDRLVLLGRMQGQVVHVGVEDDRLMVEQGWPFRSLAEEVEAVRCLAAEFQARLAEVR